MTLQYLLTFFVSSLSTKDCLPDSPSSDLCGPQSCEFGGHILQLLVFCFCFLFLILLGAASAKPKPLIPEMNACSLK